MTRGETQNLREKEGWKCVDDWLVNDLIEMTSRQYKCENVMALLTWWKLSDELFEEFRWWNLFWKHWQKSEKFWKKKKKKMNSLIVINEICFETLMKIWKVLNCNDENEIALSW